MLCINVMTKRIHQTLASRRWRERNPDKNCISCRIWAKENPVKSRAHVDAWQKANPDKKLAIHRAWSKTHPEKLREYTANRRARKLNSEGNFTAQQFQELCCFYGEVCLCCGLSNVELKVLGRILVPDHVQPLSKGGSNDLSNIQPLCHGIKIGSKGGCNNSKGTKNIDYRPLCRIHSQRT